MNSRIKYNFPETRFVRENNIGKQFSHILSEVAEAFDLFQASDVLTARHFEELADLSHSLETLWRIVERHHGSDLVAQIFAAVQEKNSERGYYEQLN